ncbi:hypothetical protein QUB37_01100 [Microcoleus sp. AT3-A2]|uniref:hypothetical protein n=1 Tax=unclassified Microcoleus TaxID=2642155 RepID=UPI002FCE93CE
MADLFEIIELLWDMGASIGSRSNGFGVIAGAGRSRSPCTCDDAEVIRIGIQRVGAIGSFLGQKPLVPVTQWSIIKN